MTAEDRPDVDARNRDFIAYEQVDKRQDYRLAEGGAEAFDEEFQIRTIDLGRLRSAAAEDQAALARELGEALTEIGFAVLTNTGVDTSLYPRAEEAVIRMFEDTPSAEKLRFAARRHGSINQGYFPIEETTKIHPDLVEGWVFCRRAFESEPDEFWPRPEYAELFAALCREHEALIVPLMRTILRFFACDPQLYDDRLSGTNYALRLNYYPPLRERERRSGAGRLLGHEDVTLFTMLPAPTIEGLQVLNRRNFKWIRVQAPPGSLIFNTGDYMQRITNDVLPSTTHRVSKPRDPDLCARARASFPMNVYLWEDEMLELLPCFDADARRDYPPIRAIEFHTKTTAKYYGDDYAVSGDS